LHPLEQAAISLRRSPIFKNAEPLWRAARPMYARVLRRWKRTGLERCINGTDRVLIAPELYNMPEEYEPDVWRQVMGAAPSGGVVVDVGAYIGLYAIALAQRVGPKGKVYAFEPEPNTFKRLQQHIHLNNVQSQVQLWPCAVGEHSGSASFLSGRSSESHLASTADETSVTGGITVQVVTLDEVLDDTAVALLKVDVEGFEEGVLRGAARLLNNKKRAPRAIFIEVHPFNWESANTTSESLLQLLDGYGYEVFDMQGARVQHIVKYGEIVARRKESQ